MNDSLTIIILISSLLEKRLEAIVLADYDKNHKCYSSANVKTVPTVKTIIAILRCKLN